MKAINFEQAQRIAERNAAQMTAEGYSYTPAKTEGYFWVVKPDGDKYLVSSFLTYCDCPFGQENGICKHSVWLADELAWADSVAAREAEYAPVDRIA